MADAYIEAYSYADAGGLHTTARISEANAPLELQHDTPLAFLDQLAWFSAEGLPVTYSAATDRVTIGPMAGDPVLSITLPGNMRRWLGFSSSSLDGETSYTGDLPPGGICPLVGADIDTPQPAERAEVRRMRHGVAVATVWQAMTTRRVTLFRRDDGTERLGGWLVTGRVRITDAAGDVAEGFVAEETQIDTFGHAEEWLLRELTLIEPIARTYASPQAQQGLWAATQYGWGVLYVLLIAGVPTAWAELEVDGINPGSWVDPLGGTIAGGLVVSDSSEIGIDVDRQTGVGAGLPLSFELLDSPAVADLLRRSSRRTVLTEPLDHGDTTAHVASTAGWPSSGGFYIGHEYITYTSTTATTFVDLGRGAANTMALDYRTGYALQTVSDRPLLWRGRLVELWACPIDPTGYHADPDGDALIGLRAQQVFVGALEGEPRRTRTGFAFDAQSIDRLLARELSGEVTGEVTGERFVLAQPAWQARMDVSGFDGAGAQVYSASLVLEPMAAETPGALLSAHGFLQMVGNAWSTAVSAAGLTSYLDVALGIDDYGAVVKLTPVFLDYGGVEYVQYAYWWGIQQGPDGAQNLPAAYGLTGPAAAQWYWLAQGPALLVPVSNQSTYTLGTSLAFLPDDGDPTGVPANGTLRLSSGNQTWECKYLGTATDGATVFVAGVQPTDGGTLPSNLTGMTVKVATKVSGTAADITRQVVTSTGAGINGGDDVLPAGQGLGLPVDLIADELALLADSPQMEAWISGTSLAELLGGWLALRQRALVLRLDANGWLQTLEAVSVASGGADWQLQISDADLVGLADEPVGDVERLRPPNTLELSRITTQDEDEPSVMVSDPTAVQVEGRESWDLQLPIASRDVLVAEAQLHGRALLSMDRAAQAIKLRLPPWTPLRVGDNIRLAGLSHPALWQWSTGEVGYTGVGRVTGLQRDLKTGIQTATLLVDGGVASTSLSPAFAVKDYVGSSSAPTLVILNGTAPRAHLALALELAGGPVRLLHYQPGSNEGTAEWIEYDEVGLTTSPADTVLVVSGLGLGGNELSIADSDQSWLTLPHLAGSGTAYQDGFAHVDDGSNWEA